MTNDNEKELAYWVLYGTLEGLFTELFSRNLLTVGDAIECTTRVAKKVATRIEEDREMAEKMQ